MDLGKKIAIIVLLLTIGISIKMILDTQIDLSTQPEVAGSASSWLYRRAIDIESDSHTNLFDEQILVEINTKELISSGKLLPDCSDIRFLDEDNETPLRYYIEGDDVDTRFVDKEEIEGSCNSEETKIWITIPSLRPEGKTIYFLYGNSYIPNLKTVEK